MREPEASTIYNIPQEEGSIQPTEDRTLNNQGIIDKRCDFRRKLNAQKTIQRERKRASVKNLHSGLNKAESPANVEKLSTGQSTVSDISAPEKPRSEPLDAAKLNHLMVVNKDRLYRFILKNTGNPVASQDLLQQTFVEALKNYQSFRGDSAPSTWMFGIARNVVRNYIYRSPHQRYSFVGEETLLNEPTADYNPEQAIQQKERMAHIENAMSALPKKLRDVLISVAFQEKSYDDAGIALGISIGTVRSRLSRARAFLRRKLSSRSLPPAVKLPRHLGGDLYDSLRQSLPSTPASMITARLDDRKVVAGKNR